MYFKNNILLLFAFIVNTIVNPLYSLNLRQHTSINTLLQIRRTYPLSRKYHEEAVKRSRTQSIINKIRNSNFKRYYSDDNNDDDDDDYDADNDYEADDEENDMIRQILKKDFGQAINGPSQPVVDRIRNQYIWEILIKMPKDPATIRKCKQILDQQSVILQNHKRYRSVSMIPDVDPV
jgi:hypothetical protein